MSAQINEGIVLGFGASLFVFDDGSNAAAESQRYRIIAQRIERGQVDGPDAHLFLRVGLRSKYRGM